MKRYGRRTLGVLIGLTLGWIAQGYCQSYFATRAMASEAAPVAIQDTGQADALSSPGAPGATAGVVTQGDAPLAGAEHLLPAGTDLQISSLAVTGLIGLLVFAMIVGTLAKRFEDPIFDPTSAYRPTEPIMHYHKGEH